MEDEKIEQLNDRVIELIKKYENRPEKARRALRLASKLVKANNEELEEVMNRWEIIDTCRDNGPINPLSGLIQSMLYLRGEDIQEFDKPFGGAYIEFAKEGEANYAVFSGVFAGEGSLFSGDGSGSYALFSGQGSGNNTEFSGEDSGDEASFKGDKRQIGLLGIIGSGQKAKFSGKNAGRYASFSGRFSGRSAEFTGEDSGREAKFEGYDSGNNAKFTGETSGIEAAFSGDGSGMFAKFKYNINPDKFTGKDAGYMAKINGRTMDIDISPWRTLSEDNQKKVDRIKRKIAYVQSLNL